MNELIKTTAKRQAQSARAFQARKAAFGSTDGAYWRAHRLFKRAHARYTLTVIIAGHVFNRDSESTKGILALLNREGI